MGTGTDLTSPPPLPHAVPLLNFGIGKMMGTKYLWKVGGGGNMQRLTHIREACFQSLRSCMRCRQLGGEVRWLECIGVYERLRQQNSNRSCW